jgi:ubiquinone/menaquinone biosynthesis C-methylase UbiE
MSTTLRWTGLVLAVACSSAAQPPEHRAHDDRGEHGNPSDLQAYIRNLSDPTRDEWQMPARVVAALGVQPGETVCDIGAGPGYFTIRLGAAVGRTGHVYAVDVEPVILAALRDRLDEAGVLNVTPVLALAGSPALPASTCDLALIVNTYHHFPDGPAYLRRLAGALKPGGRVANVDFRVGSTRGPRHKLSREDFLAQATSAGYALEREESFLPDQYFVFLRPEG